MSRRDTDSLDKIHDNGVGKREEAPNRGRDPRKMQNPEDQYWFSRGGLDILNSELTDSSGGTAFRFDTKEKGPSVLFHGGDVVAEINWGPSPTIKIDGEQVSLSQWIGHNYGNTYVRGMGYSLTKAEFELQGRGHDAQRPDV